MSLKLHQGPCMVLHFKKPNLSLGIVKIPVLKNGNLNTIEQNKFHLLNQHPKITRKHVSNIDQAAKTRFLSVTICKTTYKRKYYY